MSVDPSFRLLLYRYLFFDWLFVDMSEARGRIGRRAAWRHNCAARRHLPTYLRRWLALASGFYLVGVLFEQVMHQCLIAACFFGGSSLGLTGMVQILILWALLSSAET